MPSLSKSALAVAALGVSCVSAFSPSNPAFAPALRPAPAKCASTHATFSLARPQRGAARVVVGQGAGSTDWTEVPDGQKPFQASERSIDEWLEKFTDSRNSMRTMAAKMVAAMHEEDGREREIIDLLIKKMTVENMEERRTAVQCLGMIGDKVLQEVTDIMLTTDDMVVRASCAKAIGAVALKNPETVPDFPQYCLDAMKKAALEIPDPITKLAVMSGLSQIGNDCERGLDTILDICKASDDVALLTQSMNALGSIAQNNPEWKGKISAGMQEVKKSKKGVEGFDVLEQMISVQIDKCSEDAGNFGSLGALGDGQANTLDALKRQMNDAFKSGYNKGLKGL